MRRPTIVGLAPQALVNRAYSAEKILFLRVPLIGTVGVHKCADVGEAVVVPHDVVQVHGSFEATIWKKRHLSHFGSAFSYETFQSKRFRNSSINCDIQRDVCQDVEPPGHDARIFGVESCNHHVKRFSVCQRKTPPGSSCSKIRRHGRRICGTRLNTFKLFPQSCGTRGPFSSGYHCQPYCPQHKSKNNNSKVDSQQHWRHHFFNFSRVASSS